MNEALDLKLINSKHGDRSTVKVEISGKHRGISVEGYTYPIHLGLLRPSDINWVYVQDSMVLNRAGGGKKAPPDVTRQASMKIADLLVKEMTRLGITENMDEALKEPGGRGPKSPRKGMMLLFLASGRNRDMRGSYDYGADAPVQWVLFRTEEEGRQALNKWGGFHDVGGGNFSAGGAGLVYDDKGKVIARYSPNGRWWTPETDEYWEESTDYAMSKARLAWRFRHGKVGTPGEHAKTMVWESRLHEAWTGRGKPPIVRALVQHGKSHGVDVTVSRERSRYSRVGGGPHYRHQSTGSPYYSVVYTPTIDVSNVLDRAGFKVDGMLGGTTSWANAGGVRVTVEDGDGHTYVQVLTSVVAEARHISIELNEWHRKND